MDATFFEGHLGGPSPSRRGVLMAGLSLTGAMLASCSRRPESISVTSSLSPGIRPLTLSAMPSRSTRFVHLTDLHVKPGDPSMAGVAAALRQIDELSPRPEFIVTGGDHIACSLYSTPDDAHAQWHAYLTAMDARDRLPLYPLLGNHDMLGWGRQDLFPSTPGYGKRLAQNYLNLPTPYYSLDAGRWHIICLDNIASRIGHPAIPYYGDLDPIQLDWLRQDLASNGDKPICIVTHIPLLSAAVFFDGDLLKEDHYRVPDAWMHRNARPLLELLAQHNVRLCLSGHIHLLDRVEYMGMSFICDGALSGNWWKGSYQHTPPGFGVLDLHPDGSFDHAYLPLHG